MFNFNKWEIDLVMVENCNPNIDPRIKNKSLLPAMVIKNFVDGEEDCNYEKYLLELLNHSNYFEKKGKGEYCHPPEESHGECDAISPNYELDFKLLEASSSLQAQSILSPSVCKIADGVTSYGRCKKPKGYIESTRIHAVCRYMKLEEFNEIYNKKKENMDTIEKDILKVLNSLKKEKNILLFYPFELSVDDEIEVQQLDDIITSALNNDFYSLFLYRESNVKSFDTYFVTIVFEDFFIYEVQNQKLVLIEKVNSSQLSTFMKLRKYDPYKLA